MPYVIVKREVDSDIYDVVGNNSTAIHNKLEEDVSPTVLLRMFGIILLLSAAIGFLVFVCTCYRYRTRKWRYLQNQSSDANKSANNSASGSHFSPEYRVPDVDPNFGSDVDFANSAGNDHRDSDGDDDGEEASTSNAFYGANRRKNQFGFDCLYEEQLECGRGVWATRPLAFTPQTIRKQSEPQPPQSFTGPTRTDSKPHSVDEVSTSTTLTVDDQTARPSSSRRPRSSQSLTQDNCSITNSHNPSTVELRTYPDAFARFRTANSIDTVTPTEPLKTINTVTPTEPLKTINTVTPSEPLKTINTDAGYFIPERRRSTQIPNNSITTTTTVSSNKRPCSSSSDKSLQIHHKATVNVTAILSPITDVDREFRPRASVAFIWDT